MVQITQAVMTALIQPACRRTHRLTAWLPLMQHRVRARRCPGIALRLCLSILLLPAGLQAELRYLASPAQHRIVTLASNMHGIHVPWHDLCENHVFRIRPDSESGTQAAKKRLLQPMNAT